MPEQEQDPPLSYDLAPMRVDLARTSHESTHFSLSLSLSLLSRVWLAERVNLAAARFVANNIAFSRTIRLSKI